MWMITFRLSGILPYYTNDTAFYVSFVRYEDMIRAIEMKEEKISLVVKQNIPSSVAHAGYPADIFEKWNIWDNFHCANMKQWGRDGENEWQRKCLLNL